MPISSMTGFARHEGASHGASWVWEARSVNARGLDIRVRLPSGQDALEGKAREALKARFARGSVQVSLQMRADELTEAHPSVNRDRLSAMITELRPFIIAGAVEPPRLDGLLSLPGVIEKNLPEPDKEREAALSAAVMASFDALLDRMAAARTEEGAALERVLTSLLDETSRLRTAAAAHASVQPHAIRDRLTAQLSELLGENLPQERLTQEAAMLAVKADTREELDRLDAHIDSARQLIVSGEPCGRRLDFLSQEFMREANTLCAKAADIELTRIGLDLKAVIDQMKEQAANVE